MTVGDLDTRPAPEPGVGRSAFGLGMNLLGVAVVAFWLVANGIRLQSPVWVFVVAGVALAAWAVRELVTKRTPLVLSALVMILAGALASSATDSLLIVPVIVGIVVLEADPKLPLWSGVVAGLAGVTIVGVTVAVDHRSVEFVLGNAAGMLLGVLIGISRRQFRIAEAERREAEREQQRAALLADRSRAARDIHDVLAHSLGGLVLQLDAVEALLEAGRVDEATRRAGEARTLAVDGLAEARRAVHALRDDQAALPEPADRPTEHAATEAATASRPVRPNLAELVLAHRSFGGQVVTQGDLTLQDLDDAHAAAVVMAAREALSNARKHAPGAGVSLSVIRDGDAVDVVIANPLAGDGHGLVGMHERFAELGDASMIEAERSDGEFVVAMHVLAAPDAEHEGASEPVSETGA